MSGPAAKVHAQPKRKSVKWSKWHHVTRLHWRYTGLHCPSLVPHPVGRRHRGGLGPGPCVTCASPPLTLLDRRRDCVVSNETPFPVPSPAAFRPRHLPLCSFFTVSNVRVLYKTGPLLTNPPISARSKKETLGLEMVDGMPFCFSPCHQKPLTRGTICDLLAIFPFGPVHPCCSDTASPGFFLSSASVHSTVHDAFSTLFLTASPAEKKKRPTIADEDGEIRTPLSLDDFSFRSEPQEWFRPRTQAGLATCFSCSLPGCLRLSPRLNRTICCLMRQASCRSARSSAKPDARDR